MSASYVTTHDDTVSTAPEGPAPAPPLPPAPSPRGAGIIPWVAGLLALGLIALGVVGIQEALVRSDVVAGTSWTRSALVGLDDLGPRNWMLASLIGVALVGLLIVVAAARPRPARTVALTARTGVHLRTKDLSRIAWEVLGDVDGVLDVRTRARRRSLRVSATTFRPGTDHADLTADIEARLAPSLSALAAPPRLVVRLKDAAPR